MSDLRKGNYEQYRRNYFILHKIWMVVLGDFNAKSNSWYANDNTNIEGSKIDILTDSFGFNQIIKEPTHILNNLLLAST